ncbi:sucrase ferredoxin [Streptomyces sp. NPDC048650]|uniref:sucrase ferredoxin n=1 Tax=unclassified Streptomyces TaxID=2593676 RepID=UPI0037235B1A
MSTCATTSRESTEPVAGTAATARTWLLIEQTGPWGANALTDSHLDPHIGRALDAAAADTGVRIALIRRPGRHADCHGAAGHRVFVAHTAPGRSWIRTTTVSDPRTILELDFTALGTGEHGDLWDAYTGEPLVLVCTNGKRDRCCALLGRPLAAELAASGAEAWEVTHIGGHRFSPTLFVLPYGYAYGRASAHLVKDAVEAARDGRVTFDHCRGRSTWERPAQAADLAVRELIRETRADALDVVRTDSVRPELVRSDDRAPAGGTVPRIGPAWSVFVAHTDGRSWRVAVEQRADGAPAPASCGAPLGPPARMAVTSITPTSDITASARTPWTASLALPVA